MARTLASAWVNVSPAGFAQFARSANAGIRAALKGTNATVPVQANTKPAGLDIDKLKVRLAEFSKTIATARLGADTKQAEADLARMQVKLTNYGHRLDSARITLEGAAKVEAELLGVEAAFDRVQRKGDVLAPSLSEVGGTLGNVSTGFLGVVAAGVALAPVLVTVGTGAAGLAAAAARTVAPILAAGNATAQARKQLAALDPAQRAAYDSLGALKTQFGQFAKALEPVTLGLFNTGLHTASGLIKDLGPVTSATGKALNGMLGEIDAEFRSQTWQRFFDFMAQQAGPDVKLLSNALLPLLDTLPKLLTDLQPVAVELLQTADGALKLADAAITLNDRIQHLGKQADSSGGFLGKLADAAKRSFNQMFPGVSAAQKLASGLGQVGSNSDRAGTSTKAAGDKFQGAWPKAQSYAQWVQQAATATTNLANAQDAAVSAQLAYGNDMLTSANDAETFRQKLRASAGQIGLHTQAQRDSFGAANTYIGDLSRQATAAIASGHGTDAAIGAIRNGLPVLDSAKTRSKQYWQEVRTLDNYLHQLELMKFISTAIHVTGAGKWSVTGTTITPGVAHGPQNIGAAPTSTGAARGVYVSTGTGPTADDVLIRASKGELVVPAGMVKAGAVDHLRGRIPGFAAGGVAGSFGPGNPAGLPVWVNGRLDATDRAISQATAQAILNAMAAAQAAAKAAQRAAQRSGGPGVSGAGPVGGDAAANRALARQMFPWNIYTQWGAFETLEMHEAGWNRFARNPSSGAYGLPQAYPPTKMPFAAQAAGGSHAGPQLAWMFSYIRSVYGTPAAAWAQYYNHPGGAGSYAAGGLVTPAERAGQTWLDAWRSRRGGGFGAAWGPVVLNQQIPDMAAAISRATVLSHASGLSSGQHRFWSAAAADEKKRLAVLKKELTTERTWRTQLGGTDATLAHEISAAGNLPALAGNVRSWRSQLKAHQFTIGQISGMLGYSDAYLASHPPAPSPGVIASHQYGGDVPVANWAAPLLAAALPFALGGRVRSYDSGGMLPVGTSLAFNGTGRPEPVGQQPVQVVLQVQGAGSGTVDEAIVQMLRKRVRVSGNNVQRALGLPGSVSGGAAFKGFGPPG